MQEIEYVDGTETKELFNTLEEAIEDAKRKNKRKPIKKLTITKVIPKKRRKR